MTQLLIRLFVKNYRQAEDPAVRTSYGKLAGCVGIFCNLLLALGKFAAGTVFGSIAIVADALNNLSDASSSVISLLGFKLAAKPADNDHPYGHARYEYLAGLAVAVMILVIGVELAKSSLEKILHPTPVLFSLVTVAVLAATVISHLSGLNLDGWMGLAVALFILYSGVGLVRDTLNPLLGEAPSEELTRHVHDKVMSYPGVLGVHDLMVHDYGPGQRFATLHVEMAAEQDALEAHDLIDNIEHAFWKEDRMHVVIHYDPIVTGDAAVNDLRAWLGEAVKTIDPALSVHDLRLVPGTTHTNVIFDCVTPPQFRMSDLEVRQALKKLLAQRDPKYVCVVNMEHSFAAIPHDN